MADQNRHARVEIGVQQDGTPSLKINGVECAMQIAADGLRLEWMPSAMRWRLVATFIETEATVDVQALLDIDVRQDEAS